jgi:hypothetical protein
VHPKSSNRALIGTLNSRLQNVHTVRDVPGKVPAERVLHTDPSVRAHAAS